jgi:hypothetical protein
MSAPKRPIECVVSQGQRQRGGPTISLLRATVLAGILPFVVAIGAKPVFAQHGGGGGHAGGGHVGGGPGTAASNGGGGRAAGGTVRGPMAGRIMSRMNASAGAGSSGSRRFSAGSRIWMDPDAARDLGMDHFAGALRLVPRTVLERSRGSAVGSSVPLVEMMRVSAERRFGGNGFLFFGGGCFNGFFPGFCSFGPGAFAFPFWEFWGWDNDGFGQLDSFGYPFAPSMSDEIEARVDNQPQYYESAPFGLEYQYPPAANGPTTPSGKADGGILMLYLKDGSVYGLTTYWVADGRLHYVTSYGGENSLSLEQVDVQHTVDVNSKRGVPFILTPAATAGPGAEKSQAPNP